MKSNSFSTEFLVEHSAKEVFNAINNVTGWWCLKTEGNTTKSNDTFKVDFQSHWWGFKIIELTPYEKVMWQVTDSYMPWNKNQNEWTDTKIVFEITKTGNQTRLQFTHVGLVPQFACFTGCSKGWTGYIKESLLNLITTGTGNPDYPY
jgi:hypothetical protein